MKDSTSEQDHKEDPNEEVEMEVSKVMYTDPPSSLRTAKVAYEDIDRLSNTTIDGERAVMLGVPNATALMLKLLPTLLPLHLIETVDCPSLMEN